MNSQMLRDHAEEAGAMVIGGVMLSPDVLAEIDITPEEFINPNQAKIFAAIIEVSKSKPVDLTTVSQHLELQTGRKWAQTIAPLMHNMPSAVATAKYSAIVREKGRLIRGQQLLSEFGPRIQSEGMDAIDQLAGELLKLGMTGQTHEYSIKEGMRALVDEMDARRKDRIQSLSTGYYKLDEMISGLNNTDLVVIAGRPASGKTAFLLNLMLNIDCPAGMISTEQGITQVAQRIVAREGRMPANLIRCPKEMEEKEWDLFTAITKKLIDKSQLWVNDFTGPTMADVTRQARKWKHLYGIKCLFVDYIQRIKPTDPRLPKHERVGESARALKDLARELDIPIVALAQVSRKCEERDNKRPRMGDISDSSEIEKEADQIMTLYRDEVYNPTSPTKGVIEICVDKNRHGPIGIVPLRWEAPIMTVGNMPEGYQLPSQEPEKPQKRGARGAY